MVKRLLLVSGLLFCVAYLAQAQLPPDCGGPPSDVPPAEDCPSTCIYCDFANYMGNTAGYVGNGIPPGGFCSMIQNDQWLGFIAGSASAAFNIIPSNCDNGDGVQVALYESCNTAPIACNPGCAGCGNTTTTIVASMVVGTNYFLLIDGLSGDVCDLTINVVPASAVQAPPVGAIGNITGPATVCPGATVPYQVASVTGAGAYTWSSPTAGMLFNGQFSPAQFDAPDGRIVQITFPSGVTGNVQICVNADNSCNAGTQRCRTVNVQPIPPTTFMPVTVCNEDAPYILPWGDEANTVGKVLYKTTLTSYLGCDSVVQQQVTIKPALTTNIGAKYVCAGGTITVCGNVLDTGGPISEMCTSFQGCDSLVTGQLVVLDPIAEILGGGTLTCVTPSVTLNSTGSSGTKIWRRLPGTVLGVTPSITVTQPGTITLTTTQTLGGTTCIKADTIVIDGNTTPPVAGATTTGFLGCGNASTSVAGSSNAPNSTYNWTGPGGFTGTGQTVTASTAGFYTVTVQNPVNGCTSTATTEVTGNTTPPTVTATGATLTCAVTSIGISSTSSAPISTFSWAGPNSFTSTQQNPSVTAAGTYTVTITNSANNCSSTATAVVTLNNTVPTASTQVDGAISCPTPVLTIGTNTNAAGPTYQWGPTPFNSTAANPSVNAAGTYTVTITAAGGNGCTATASATVTGDTNLPNVSAVGDTVSCGTPVTVLNGGSTTAGVTYLWTGGTFTPNATVSDPTVGATGVYILTVSAPNGCTSTASAEVAGDFVVPTGVTASGGIITCGSSSTTITSNSATQNVTYTWTGPGNFMSNLPTTSATNTGIYTIKVTASNGCTATATAEVMQDSNVPEADASGGTINCVNNSVVLDGNSNTAGVTLAWTGPNGFASTVEDPTVSVSGIYTLTVTNPANGCTKLAEANVNLDTIVPGATATGALLTCTNPSQTLVGFSPLPSVTWSWTGPGTPPFSSTMQNPTASDAGFYTLTVTATGNGCTSVAVAELQADQNLPVAASTTGTLTCAVTSIILNGSSTLPATFKWTGPGTFISNIAAPNVSVPGDYALTVTAGNGCTDLATVTVLQDIAPPGATATGATISCTNPQVPIGVTTPATGPTYAWAGPGLPGGSADPNPTVGAPGTYTVTVTGAVNGCTSTATAVVASDTEVPVLAATAADPLTCAVVSVDIQATATNATSAVQMLEWTGPNSFTSNLEDPSVTLAGVYVLLATSANGCTATFSVTVQENKAAPNASASAGILTCFNPVVPVEGSSFTTGATFGWTGPNNFTSSVEDPQVSEPGVYVLTVTNPVNGCTATSSATMGQNTVPPGATTAKSDDLDCAVVSVTLQGGPSADVTYQWAGPSQYNKTEQNPATVAPGIYTLTTTSTVNGCTSTNTVEVLQDIAAPGAAATGDTLDCTTGTGEVNALSQTAGVIYAWSGPLSYNSTLQNPKDITTDGVYTVTITAPNGCTSTATTTVAKNQNTPDVQLVGAGILTCSNDSITLTATINTPGVTFEWKGPNFTNTTSTTVQVTLPGAYTIVVTNPANGCVSQPSVSLTQNIQKPQAVTAVGGQIDCVSPTISITGNSTSAGATYAWSGPGAYTSTQKIPNNVTNPGVYTLTVTGQNGCTESVTATVTLDPTVPDIMVATETITCLKPSVTLQATTGSPTTVTWKWTGPDITPATETTEDPVITKPGAYSVVVKANSSGCTATFNINVLENKVPPGATATGATQTCAQPSVTVTSATQTQNVTYNWGGPGTFSSTLQNPATTLVGIYTVTITAQNGCTSTATAQVLPDASAPQITAAGGTVSCAVLSITLQATTNVGVTWLWTGPGGFSSTAQNPVVTQAGNYTVQATAQNGCSVSTAAVVIADTAVPDIKKEVPEELDCTTTQVNLSAVAQGAGNYTYNWTTATGSIVSGGTTPTPTASQAGQYVVTVTNTQNGCTSSAEVTVLTDPATPSGVASQVRDVSCFGDTNGAVLVDSVEGGTAPFLFSLDNGPFSSQTSFASLPPGPHVLMIQDANGCEFETTLTVLEPEELLVDLGSDTTIHLGDGISLSLGDIVNFPGRVKDLIVKPAEVVRDSTIYPVRSFRYTATVVDSNGCKAVDDRVVIVDKTRLVYVPNVVYPESSEGNEIMRISVGQDVERVNSFQVYDRWGAAVFERRNFLPDANDTGAWNGTVKGDKSVPAVFVWYAEILFKDGEVEIFKGDVTVVR